MEIKKIGIIGRGIVGGAMYRYFKKKMSVEVVAYDKGKNEGSIKEVNEADIIFICVPTPWKEKHFDTSIVEEAIRYLKESKVIVIKSTVSIGATRRLQEKFPQHTIIFNPEFLTEQTADQDMNYPDRQIIGYCNKKGYRISKDILDILPLAQCERIVPAEAAEAVKLFGNAWFATKVALNNQFYDIWKGLGYHKDDYQKIADIMAMDKRIGRTHLRIWHKGYRGFGGACLPKDTNCVIEQGGKNASILKEVVNYNDKLRKDNKDERDR